MCTKPVLALLFGLSVSAVVYAAQSVPSAGTELPTITLDSPVKITHSVRIAPGVYRLPVPDGGAVIEVAADNVVLDLTGVTIESGAKNPWDRVEIGIHSRGDSHISIQGGTVRG